VHVRALEHEDVAAAGRLAELGLSAEDLDFALRGADAEARTWSPAAPPIMPGLARWGKTNELLRLRLLPRGWWQDNPKLLPRTISPDRSHAIVATAGDAATGVPGANPTTRYAKGIETARAIGRNIQLAFDLPGLTDWPDSDGDPVETWLLLYDVTPERIRAELSLAGAISDTGFVGAWRERIILPVIELTSPDITSRILPGDRGEEGVTVAVGRVDREHGR
jgi:hypothetical protein